MKIQGIYSITHTASGRVYVGSAVDIASRWHIHRHHLRQGIHHAVRLQAAWSSDGADAFTFGVLELVADKKDLLIREQWWIDELNTIYTQTGFNSCPVAGSPLGTTHSDAAKAKMRAAKMGKPAPWNARKHTDEQNQRQSEVMTGRTRGPHSPEHCAKISVSHLGNKYGIGNKGTRGRKATDETRAKLSAARMGNTNAVGNKNRLGQPVSEATRALMSANATGNKNCIGFRHSAEARANMSAGQQARQARKRAALLHSPSQDQVAALPVRLRREPPSPAGQACLSFD